MVAQNGSFHLAKEGEVYTLFIIDYKSLHLLVYILRKGKVGHFADR